MLAHSARTRATSWDQVGDCTDRVRAPTGLAYSLHSILPISQHRNQQQQLWHHRYLRRRGCADPTEVWQSSRVRLSHGYPLSYAALTDDITSESPCGQIILAYNVNSPNNKVTATVVGYCQPAYCGTNGIMLTPNGLGRLDPSGNPNNAPFSVNWTNTPAVASTGT